MLVPTFLGGNWFPRAALSNPEAFDPSELEDSRRDGQLAAFDDEA